MYNVFVVQGHFPLECFETNSLYIRKPCTIFFYEKVVKINDLCIGTENIFISPRLFFQDVRVPRSIFCEERIAIAFVIPGKPLSKKKIQY